LAGSSTQPSISPIRTRGGIDRKPEYVRGLRGKDAEFPAGLLDIRHDPTQVTRVLPAVRFFMLYRASAKPVRSTTSPLCRLRAAGQRPAATAYVPPTLLPGLQMVMSMNAIGATTKRA